jgi:hypothetical protein
MVALGIDQQAHGMANQAQLDAYDWNNDLSEMATAALAGLNVSNHSYGKATGWDWDDQDSVWRWFGDSSVSVSEDYRFGFYGSRARDLDDLTHNAPNYLVVVAAGNDRTDTGTNGAHRHGLSQDTYTDIHDRDGGADGYECIAADVAISKNVVTIGAVHDIPNGYVQPSDAVIADFSSWGPTDDGRIKPDLVANGTSLYSTVEAANDAYDRYSGTSMATPSVSGSVALLLQHQRNLHGSIFVHSSTLKALLIHTADEAGISPGPDYTFGWGLLNTHRAADVMTHDAQSGASIIRELVLNQGEQIEVRVQTIGTEPLRATICWNDPPGVPPPVSLNPPDRMIQNDLDLRVVAANNTTYLPYVLDPTNPGAAAFGGDNIRDNVEQVYIQTPIADTYTVRITGKGSLLGASQALSFVVSGATAQPSISVTYPSGGETWSVGSYQLVQWTSSSLQGNVTIRLSTDGGFSFPLVIASDLPNDGSERIIVPNSPSQSCFLRVQSTPNPSIFGQSVGAFTIDPPVSVWIRVGLDSNSVPSLATKSRNRVFAGTVNSSQSSFFRSTDMGFSWTHPQDPPPQAVWSIATSPNGDVFAGTWSWGVYRSTDDGANWAYAGLGNSFVKAITTNASGDVFAGLFFETGVYKSTDNGNTWNIIGLSGTSINNIVVGSTGPIFVGTQGGQVYRSTNDGSTWSLIFNDPLYTNLYVGSVAVGLNGHIFVGTGPRWGVGRGVYRSTDSGASWQLVNTGLSSRDVWSLKINRDNHIFAGTTDAGVFYSTNDGSNWTYSGLGNACVTSLSFDSSGYLFAGTYDVYGRTGAVFRTTSPSTTSTSMQTRQMIPMTATLLQNFPNPFNPKTTIVYSVPEEQHVLLKVYDVLGKEIITLVDEQKLPGNHKVEWRPTQQSSGVYFYRLRTGDFIGTRQMLLLR